MTTPDATATEPTPAPQDGPPAPPATPSTPPAPAGDQGGETPPWEKRGEEFDADKAWKLIENKDGDIARLRRRLDELEPLAKQAKELEDAKKTAEERLTEERDQLRGEVQAANTDLGRMRAVLNAIPEDSAEGAFIRKILSVAGRVQGSTPEELEADAKDLFEQFGLVPGAQAPTTPPPGRSGRPRETLRPGAVPDAEEPDETDPAKLAELVSRGLLA